MNIQTQHIKNPKDKSLSDEEAPVWYDIQGTYEEFSNYLETLSIPQKIREAASENQHFPEAKIFSSCVMLRLPVRNDWIASRSSYITFLIFTNQLITFHHDHIQFFTKINRDFEQDEDLDERTVASLVTYIIDSIVEVNIRCFTSARVATESLSGKIDDPSVQITEEDIIKTRRQASRLLCQFEDQFYALTSLRTQHTKKSELLDALCLSIKDSTESQGHLVLSLSHLEMRLRDMQQYFQYIMERKTEQRLRFLTILSTIYMPLTLITGIYGMNFANMPELGFKYAYYITLGAMLLLTTGQLSFFYYKGWFKETPDN